MPDLPPLQAPLQDLVDWCKQPQPELVADTHVVHFFLTAPHHGEHPFVWQGFLYLHPGDDPPVHPFLRRGHFEGVGYLIPNDGVCTAGPFNEVVTARLFVRILVGLTVPSQTAGISLFRRDGNEHLPGEQPTFSFEGDVVLPPLVGGALDIAGWTLHHRKTTLRLA